MGRTGVRQIMKRCEHVRSRGPRWPGGFSLIELMIVVAIVAILASIAYPAYTRYVTKTHRVAAESCLSEYSSYMERYYTTNLRYDQATDGTTNTLPQLDCAATQQTGQNYTYDFAGGEPTASTFKLLAEPQGSQKTRDTKCGTLSVDQTGKRGVDGTGTVQECWGN